MNRSDIIIIAYIVIAVITFGHAYHQVPDTEQGRFGDITYTIHNGPGTKTAGAVPCAAAWPLYWSVWAFK
jgi:hypothetical protein